MNITEIIKDAFIFPAKNSGKYAIYLLLSVLMGGFIVGGIITCGFGIFDEGESLIGGILLLIAMLIGFIINGYNIKTIESGIKIDDDAPDFAWYENFMTGFDNVLVSIFYFIIPTIIVLLIALDTNLVGNAIAVVQEVILQIFNVYIMGDSVNIAVNVLSNTLLNFVNALLITMTSASILFIIFYILESIAEARLSNTGSLMEALNIFKTMQDIGKIGVGKLILFIILMFIIFVIIEIILITIFINVPILTGILFIILAPYLVLVTRRALGLLYSDIA